MNYLKLSALMLLLVSSLSHGQDVNTSVGRDLNRYESGVLSKATALLERNELDVALKLMIPLLEQSKPHQVVFQYVCKTLGDTGADTKALSCWLRGYQLYPQQSQIAINLGHSQLQLEQYKAAIATLTRLKLSMLDEPIAAQIRYMRGYAHYQLGQYQAAIDLLYSADVKLHWWPIISYSQLALEQWQQSKVSAQQWLTFEPANLTAWQVLTRAELGLDNKLEAAVASDVSAQLQGLSSASRSLQNRFGLFGQIKAYNLAASCTSLTLTANSLSFEAFDTQDLACAQYAWLSGRYDQGLAFLQAFNSDNLHGTAVDRGRLNQGNLGHVSFKDTNLNDDNDSMKSSLRLIDDFYLLQGQLYAALKQGDNARKAWSKVGQQILPLGTAAEIKHARQRRNELQGQAQLLIGQSYWLEQQWPEAQASYRKLAQTPGFETLAAAFGQRLESFTLREDKLR
ncbi:tetratricopeptide repeat protein [Shewanella pealeana]|uniref:Tetratricopeptide domain protein n=1 Tax=Shewanella pealeana (strain ATCC 700345 / ANG-SQ1) TaxID=398579 RepID=A8H8E6_SHEPA|nr:tetratricopeptide repeat protein [Shewanella pealeana]ABV88833.1 hypothetical protein Spea_3520 [Shewanella pealeana ATCC 700345]